MDEYIQQKVPPHDVVDLVDVFVQFSSYKRSGWPTAGFCHAFVMQRLHSTPSMVRGAPSARHCSTTCFAFHVSRSDKESEIACATKKTTPAKRQSREGRAAVGQQGREGHDGGCPAVSAVGFVVRPWALWSRGLRRGGKRLLLQQSKKRRPGRPPILRRRRSRCGGLAGRSARFRPDASFSY